MSGHDDAEETQRYARPYSPHHTIPTIQKYRKVKEAREAQAAKNENATSSQDASASRAGHARDAWTEYSNWWTGKKDSNSAEAAENASNGQRTVNEAKERDRNARRSADSDENRPEHEDVEPTVEDTSEVSKESPKQTRKGMSKRKSSGAERQVTDPVTHLPVTIRDFTASALRDAPENETPFGSTSRTATGLSNQRKTNHELQAETHELAQGHQAMRSLFPPPEFDVVRRELAAINRLGATVGLVSLVLVLPLIYGLYMLTLIAPTPAGTQWLTGPMGWLVVSAVGVGAVSLVIAGVRDWMSNRIEDVWNEAIWDASGKASRSKAEEHETESVTWLNSVLAAVWPLINPDLFTSLADTLEDVMQASLPSMVRMVSVDDIGQGSESIRILGIRWLPTGAAARTVAGDGHLKGEQDDSAPNDRSVPGEGEIENSADGDDEENRTGSQEKPDENKNPGHSEESQEDGTSREIAEGMEGEEGDFINLEVAFAYRARRSTSFLDRVKDMHLYLAFYLPANIKLPVWVDLRGIVGTLRMRLQLTPDPPFFSLCTMTFLGQPKVDIGCTPLIKRGPNIMDIPLLKNFVQSSVDAAMSEYVAPKSLTLDLKDMLAGDDFKKDTNARGVLVVTIKRGYDFRTGDPGIPLLKQGGADPYVSVGWAKFGKPLWSTRVLLSEMEPCWEETAYLLVTPQELNVDERLRVQLWDSDRLTADDDLGRIELDLKQLMKGDSNGKVHPRTDGFRALKAGEEMPGKLEWSVGYFSKVRLQQCQLEKQSFDPEIRSFDAFDEKVDRICERKLREAYIKEGKSDAGTDRKELEQQKAQERKTRSDAMIISAPPPDDYCSGVFSIQIHQATGLGLHSLQKSRHDSDAEASSDEEDGESLPSSYCTVIINHNKVYKTRTKPHNNKPFFNASVERFIPDWRSAEVFVSVRDARVHEDHPLMGIVHLPLAQVFQSRSQIDGHYPLLGGVGFGRIRLSLVWRSVQLQAPPRDLGWQFGTIEVKNDIPMDGVPEDLQAMKLKFTSDLGRGKAWPQKSDHMWQTRKNRGSIKLAVRQRYRSCMTVQFRTAGLTKKKTYAFATLWLHRIPDEEDHKITLPIYKETNGGKDLARATANCVEGSSEKLGEITIRLVFWSGMGHAHSAWASKQQNTRDVAQVLEIAHDNYLSHQEARAAGIVDEDATSESDGDESSESDSDSDVDDKGDEPRPEAVATSHAPPKFGNGTRPEGRHTDSTDAADRHRQAEVEDDGKQSIFERAKDYKQHMKRTHRQHRGVMQWKLPRTAQWAAHRVEQVEHKVSQMFKHSGREPDIETEV